MGFRTLEITRPAEIHMKNGQMHIEQEAGEVAIPLEDISVITCIGPNIRISTMGLIQLTEYEYYYNVSMKNICRRRYLPHVKAIQDRHLL